MEVQLLLKILTPLKPVEMMDLQPQQFNYDIKRKI